MDNLEYIFQTWDRLYDRNEDPQLVVSTLFHDDYTQCINGTVMNRKEYLEHVIEQRKNIKSITFEHKKHLFQADELFVIYNAKGKNNLGEDIEAEVIAYFEFKNNKILKIHGQVHLLKGTPSDVDMNH